ncbi:MAG: LicD family protein [Clostridiales bacterium]|jgi:lipopolysaccharide cholinephosphotransferase|nr:LicD family protein [Clostridiales bacterium]
MKSVYVLTKEELRSLQLILLEMLLEVDRICKKYHIKYSIDGGTLLGAVRHGGFIPWDDDLDIVMTRKEYDKFKNAAIKELDAGKYFYQDHLTDSHYRWGYAKIRRVDSEFVRFGQERLNMKTGIFLDIFPRDNVPDGFVIRRLHAFCCYFWRKVLFSEVGKITAVSAIKKIAYCVINRIPKETAFYVLEKIAKTCNKRKTKLSRCYTFPLPKKGCYGYKNEWFTQFCEITFEGYEFPAAKDNHGYLVCDYGDYMQIPSEEKRRRHPCSKFSLPKGCEDVWKTAK